MDSGGWMRTLTDDTHVSELSIPGTHDSMALYGGPFRAVAGQWVRAQKLTLPEQLESGIRFLDIRCRRVGDCFCIHHGQVYQKAQFGHVLNHVVAFLKKYPTETVLMNVQEEHKPDKPKRNFDDQMEEYLGRPQYREFYWPGTRVPKLGEVRGKFVIIQRFAGKPLGIPFRSMAVQNAWEPASAMEKCHMVDRHLDGARVGSAHTLHLNFLSFLIKISYPPNKAAKVTMKGWGLTLDARDLV